jgi:CRISPR-associated endonuclease/helicase Cas3
MDFERAFATLTGFEPFPWQKALYERFTSGRPDAIPSVASIPTGLGKTNVVAIWLLALMQCPNAIPRRLVYVVNRRTVVDQTTTEVERIRSNLAALDGPLSELAISTLRGQFADNGEWYANPARPALICGTVDMIGSRLLFSGYRIGFRSRPLHAGLLGQDALLVHDEAHLEPAFQQLVESIVAEQRRERNGRELPWPGLSVMALTATARRADDGDGFKLTDEELRPTPNERQPERPIDYVRRRLTASKTLHLHEVPKAADVAGEVAEQALSHREAGVAVLVYARTIEDVDKITAALRKKKTGVPAGQVAQLTGTMRGLERDALIETAIFKRFRGEGGSEGDTVYLVCTSAGEVGIDISADHMVCDLSTFDSMTQRLGRVNRLGDRTDSRVDVVYTADLAAEPDGKNVAGGKKSDAITDARRRTLALLKQLNGDASPLGLESLSLEARQAAFAPAPTILPATDVLFDAWAMTSIRGRLPGRPHVAPYLHGVTDWEPPRTSVAWRDEVAYIKPELIARDGLELPRTLLDDYPLKPHELLSDRSDRLAAGLVRLASRARDDLSIWIIDDEGGVAIVDMADIAAESTSGLAGRIAGQIVMLPPSAGGLTATGVFDGGAECDAELPHGYDVADQWGDDKGARRKRLLSSDPLAAGPSGMALIRSIDTDPECDDSSDSDSNGRVRRFWHWFVRPREAENTTAASLRPVLLSSHTSDVRERADAIVKDLALPGNIGAAVALAADLHDLGKQREQWQRSIGNPNPEMSFAKPGKPDDGPRWRPRQLTTYRHEFGSLLDALDAGQPHRGRLDALPGETRDLVLHLIASHHGRARPHFTDDEAADPDHAPSARRTESLEVVRRFDLLQRRLGRWGLAYVESLLRAADWTASANPSHEGHRS